MAELKAAFTESAARQLDLLGRARCDANWEIAAARLKRAPRVRTVPQTESISRLHTAKKSAAPAERRREPREARAGDQGSGSGVCRCLVHD